MADKPKKAWYFRWWAISLYIFIFLLVLGALNDDGKDKEIATKATIEHAVKKAEPVASKPKPIVRRIKLPQQKEGLPRFTLLKDKSYENAGTAKVIWEILIASDVTKESLTSLLNDLYSQARSKSFKQHDEAMVIDIKGYMSKAHAESGQGQWIGWISKSGNESQPRLAFDDRQINQLGKKPEEQAGISEEKRKEIWQEIIKAEDKANHDDKLIEEYRNELAKQRGLSRDQLNEIANEGLRKSWPFPKN